ncbi:MAG: dicarboxylate/amino acid:cation symporter [Spirochaetaceae bacterium]|nr:MAG: dicarboxylate/amino acid:cation symporter [Spirochaetaceae bacterium]
MKIWVKLLLGAVIGFIIAFFLPESADTGIILGQIAQIVINIGKYAIFPLVFFSLIISIWELRAERKLLALFKKCFFYLLLSTVLLSAIGTISGILLPTQKIPGAGDLTIPAIPLTELFMNNIFPDNLFSILIQSGFSLFPIIVLALLIGLNVDYEKQFTRPVISFADGMSRTMYHINSLFVEIFWIGMIAVGAARFFSIKTVKGTEAFLPLFITLIADVVIIVAGVYPLILFFLTKKKNPYKIMYAGLGPAITAFLSGDPYLSLGMLTKHSRENLMGPRATNNPIFSLATVFSRAGTALVVSVSFVLLRKVTFGAEIPFYEYFWIFGASIVAGMFSGLLTFPFPQTGAYAALAFVCLTYIHPSMLPDKYLDLAQIAPLLVCVGTLLDVLTSWLTAYLIQYEGNPQTDVDMRRCI